MTQWSHYGDVFLFITSGGLQINLTLRRLILPCAHTWTHINTNRKAVQWFVTNTILIYKWCICFRLLMFSWRTSHVTSAHIIVCLSEETQRENLKLQSFIYRAKKDIIAGWTVFFFSLHIFHIFPMNHCWKPVSKYFYIYTPCKPPGVLLRRSRKNMTYFLITYVANICVARSLMTKTSEEVGGCKRRRGHWEDYSWNPDRRAH